MCQVSSSPDEVVHLLLGPQADDLARVQLAKAIFKAIVVFDVFIPVLKFIQRCLENLENALLWNDLVLKSTEDENKPHIVFLHTHSPRE